MKPKRLAYLLAIVATILALRAANAQNKSASAKQPTSAAVDTAFQHFWAAGSPAEAAQHVDEIIKTGVTFDEALRRLKMGRSYSAQASGVFILKNRTEDDVEHNYAVNIPPQYDPARRYQVRFQLHGGIFGRANNQPRGTGEIGALAGAEQIYVLPYAWDAAPWWGDDQIINLNAIIDSLKRTYNIEENRVVLSGVSDGATGSYYIAMRDTTPFASFLPLNGFIFVLGNDEINDGRNFPNNLVNKPLFVVNGGQDPLYPIRLVEPFTRHLMSNGVDITYDPQPDGVHNTMWWPEVKDVFEKFVADHPRNPNPDRLSWEAADLSHNRAHWLVIDAFGAAPGEDKDLPDANAVHRTETKLIGETHGRMFDELDTAGRVDLVRTGNMVQATTKGVTAFTLLLSPDVFDFSKPIQVVANGREEFNARVERSVKTLLKWAAQDNDRTMLYAAELNIKLAP
jgi:hypothetical protein